METNTILCTLAGIVLFFTGIIGIIAMLALVMFFQDTRQTEHAVRRNYPVIGRVRYLLEQMGAFFRQYWFSQEREELPFNRATRSWVYRLSKNIGDTASFGSTYDLREPGSIIFVNALYPVLEEGRVPAPPLVIGPDCDNPFEVQRIFNISGMSFGAVSAPAIRALSRGAGTSRAWLNTGEGGLSPYHLEGDCDLIFQIGTAKFGVRDSDGRLDDQRLREVSRHVKAFEIKLAQGAKPGRGGMLPGAKVTQEVADIRGIPAGRSYTSPNRHPEVSNDEELLDMIARVRDVTGRPVGIKTVLSNDVDIRSLCETILSRGKESAPDFITLDGGDGGTGAAPQVLMDYMGLPLDEALPLLADILIETGLNERIRLVASGKLLTAERVAWALCTGADFVVSARGFMFALGCIQSLKCHLDTCPTGIATHNKNLQKGLVVKDKSVRVANYARLVNEEVDRLAHSCGLPHAREFRRHHVRLVQSPGRSLRMDKLYPYPR